MRCYLQATEALLVEFMDEPAPGVLDAWAGTVNLWGTARCGIYQGSSPPSPFENLAMSSGWEWTRKKPNTSFT